jgi:hypothetical protein
MQAALQPVVLLAPPDTTRSLAPLDAQLAQPANSRTHGSPADAKTAALELISQAQLRPDVLSAMLGLSQAHGQVRQDALLVLPERLRLRGRDRALPARPARETRPRVALALPVLLAHIRARASLLAHPAAEATIPLRARQAAQLALLARSPAPARADALTAQRELMLIRPR